MRITDRQLRKIIREEIIRERYIPNALPATFDIPPRWEGTGAANPGGAFASAASRGDSARQKKIADAMTETYSWFVQNIFPALEYDQWSPPVVADKDYLIAPDGNFLSAAVNMGDPNTAGSYIKAGTRFTSPNAAYPFFYRHANGESGAQDSRTLQEMYELLEDTAHNFNLRVPMESFPG